MNKVEMYNELGELLQGFNTGQILDLMFNWFDKDDLKEFLEFVKDECYE